MDTKTKREVRAVLRDVDRLLVNLRSNVKAASKGLKEGFTEDRAVWIERRLDEATTSAFAFTHEIKQARAKIRRIVG